MVCNMDVCEVLRVCTSSMLITIYICKDNEYFGIHDNDEELILDCKIRVRVPECGCSRRTFTKYQNHRYTPINPKGRKMGRVFLVR